MNTILFVSFFFLQVFPWFIIVLYTWMFIQPNARIWRERYDSS